MSIFTKYAIGIVFVLGMFSCSNSMSEQPSAGQRTQEQDAKKLKIERMEKLFQEYGWSFTPNGRYTREESFLLMDYDSVKLSLSQAMQKIASLSSRTSTARLADYPRYTDVQLIIPDISMLPPLQELDPLYYVGKSPEYHAEMEYQGIRCQFSMGYEIITQMRPYPSIDRYSIPGEYEVSVIGDSYLTNVTMSDSEKLDLQIRSVEVTPIGSKKHSILGKGFFVMEGFFGDSSIPGYAHAVVGLRCTTPNERLTIVGCFMEARTYSPGARFFLPSGGWVHI